MKNEGKNEVIKETKRGMKERSENDGKKKGKRQVNKNGGTDEGKLEVIRETNKE